MSAAVQNVAASPPAQLRDVAGLMFNQCAGRVVGEVRSLGGYKHEHGFMDPPFVFAPRMALKCMRGDGEELRVRLATDTGQVGAIVAVFDVAIEFSRDTGYTHVTAPRAVEAVAAALAGFALRPSAIIDALAEVVALWSLTSPVAIATALDVMEPLAARLGGRAITIETTIPLAGAPRNCGGRPRPIAYDAVDPECRYALATIAAAIEKG